MNWPLSSALLRYLWDLCTGKGRRKRKPLNPIARQQRVMLALLDLETSESF